MSELEEEVAALKAQLTMSGEEKVHMRTAFDAEKATMQATLNSLRQTLTTLRDKWHTALGTSTKQTEETVRERDAVASYAGDLESGMQKLKKTAGCRRIVAALSVYQRRTTGAAFSHMREHAAAHRAGQAERLLHHAKNATLEARHREQSKELQLLSAQRELDGIKARNDELSEEMAAMKSELHVVHEQLAATRATLATSQSAEAAARGRQASLEDRMVSMEGDLRMARGRLKTIDKELDRREDLLRTREKRLVDAEENLAQRVSEVSMLQAQQRTLELEIRDRSDAHKGTLKQLGQAKSLNVEYEGQIAALAETERKLLNREKELQERLAQAFEREEALRVQEIELDEKRRSDTEQAAARSKVLEAKQLLVRQREEQGRAQESQMRTRLDEMADARVLLERAVASETHVSTLEEENRQLKSKLDDLTTTLKERLKAGDGAPDGSALALSGSLSRSGKIVTESELSDRERVVQERERNLTMRMASLSTMEDRVRQKEAKLDKLLTNAERAQRILTQKVKAAEMKQLRDTPGATG